MSLEAIANVLQGVAQTLKTDPRNEYEAAQRYSANMARLSEARTQLDGFSGSYPDTLRNKITALEAQVTAHQTFRAAEPSNAFAVDFGGNDEVQEEVAAAEQELLAQEMKRKGKKGAKAATKKEARKQRNDDESRGTGATDAAGEDVPSPVDALQPTHTVNEDDNQAFPTWKPAETMQEVARYTACRSRDIPVGAIGKAECRLIPNTPNAALLFTTSVDFDGRACRCVVEVPRFVVLVLSNLALKTTVTVDLPAPSTVVTGVTDDDGAIEEDTGDEQASESPGAFDSQVMETGDHSNLTELSERLVSEFDTAREEEEEAENTLAGFPRELSAKATAAVRSVTDAVWVILMCHGGYFAGGVFQKETCIIHKSFQRYVVRKKQGGRQSTNAKDGDGSYNSIGSQIRAAQEVKWRLDVRSLLYAWRPYIDASSFILYVAPGPQNRSVLSDFSLLPPSTAQGEAGPSPVSFKDPRVHKAPLTTHRPSFEEVQRVFTAVSRCNVVYAAD